MLGFTIYLLALAIVLFGIVFVSAFCYICVYGIDRLCRRYKRRRTDV